MMKNIQSLSVMRGLACIAIVILHIFLFATRVFPTSEEEYFFSAAVQNVLLWAAPCFVMVSGALLLDPEREIPITKIWKKYIPKMVVALVLSVIGCTVFDAFVDQTFTDIPALVMEILGKFVYQGGWSHLWYLYMMLGIYMILPLLRVFAAGAESSVVRYTVILLLVFLSLVPTAEAFIGRRLGFYIPVQTVYPLYLLLGYLLGSRKWELPVRYCAIGFFASACVLVLLSWCDLYCWEERYYAAIGNYANILVVFQSVCIFRWISLWKQESVLQKVLSGIGKYSFEIYLLHPFVIYGLYRILGWNPFVIGG